MKNLAIYLVRGLILFCFFFSYQKADSQVISEKYLTFRYVHLIDAHTGMYLTAEKNESGSKLLLRKRNQKNLVSQIFFIRTWYDENKNPNGYSIETAYKEWGQMLCTSRPFHQPELSLMTWSWLSSPNQYWKFYRRGYNRYTIINRHVEKGKSLLYMGKMRNSDEVKQTRSQGAITWKIVNAKVQIGMNIDSQGGTVAKLTAFNQGIIVSKFGRYFGSYNFESAYKKMEADFAPCVSGDGIGSNVEYVLNSPKIPNENRYLGHSDWRIPTVEEFKSLAHFFSKHENTGGHPVWLKGSKCNSDILLGRFRADGTFVLQYKSKYNPRVKASLFLIRDFRIL